MQVSIDPIVIVVLLVGAIGVLAAVIGTVSAVRAVREARGSPTDLDEEPLRILAGRLSMIVAAQGNISDPLNLRFTIANPAVTLLRIELANQLDKSTGSAGCEQASPGVFIATVESKIVQRWYNANPYWDGETKQLPIRVFFTAHGQAASRTIWVTMSSRTTPSPGIHNVSDFAWFLEGPCSRAAPTPTPMSGRIPNKRP